MNDKHKTRPTSTNKVPHSSLAFSQHFFFFFLRAPNMTPSRFVEKQVSVTPQVVLFFLTIVFIKSPCTVSEQVVRSIYITGGTRNFLIPFDHSSGSRNAALFFYFFTDVSNSKFTWGLVLDCLSGKKNNTTLVTFLLRFCYSSIVLWKPLHSF